jgi:hypothetical protein
MYYQTKAGVKMHVVFQYYVILTPIAQIKQGSEYLFNDMPTTAHAEHPEGTSFSLPRYDSPLISPMLTAEDEM